MTNIDVANLVAQTTAPTISASWDTTAAHNGSYYNTNRTLTLTVHAPFFEYTQQYLGNHAMASITKDGAGWKTVTPAISPRPVTIPGSAPSPSRRMAITRSPTSTRRTC